MALKLHTQSIAGNLFNATSAINSWGWAEYLHSIESSGYNTIAIFLMPEEKVWEIRETDRAFVADPHFDDFKGTDRFSRFATVTDRATFTWPAAETSSDEAVTIASMTMLPDTATPADVAEAFAQLHSPSAGEPGGSPAAAAADAAVTEQPASTTLKPRGKPAKVKPAEQAPAFAQPDNTAVTEPDGGAPADAAPVAFNPDLPAWAQ